MGDLGLIPGLGGYPLQYFGLENSMDCIVHGVTKNQTRLSDFHFLSLSGNTTKVILIYQLLESGYDIDFNIVEK